jgi:hypothetical protein
LLRLQRKLKLATKTKASALCILIGRCFLLRLLFIYWPFQLQGGDNLYWTGQKFSYSLSELKDDAFYIASRECCYGIAQTYEIFESFLKSFLVELLQHKREYLELISNDESLTLNSTDDFRDLVNQFQKRGKNNKKFFWLFRKISDFYKRHEKENIWNYNMADWYDLMSEVRHAIIHNRQHFTDKVKTSIARNRNQIIFERYFNVVTQTVRPNLEFL